MKYTLLLTIVYFLSCQVKPKTKQQVAEQNVKAYVEKNVLNDPSVYEIVEFGTLDSAYFSLEEDPHYQDINDELILAEANYSFRQPGSKKLMDSIRLAKYEFMMRFSYWHKHYTGCKISHSFRAKNALGVLVLEKAIFRLDSNLAVKTVSKKD